VKPAKKAAHAHKPHKKHPHHAKKTAHAAKKAAKHPHHKPHAKHPGAAGGKGGKAGHAKAAPGSVCGDVYVPVSTAGIAFDAAPAFVDLSPAMPPVWHQGDEDSCLEYAVSALYLYAGGIVGTDVSDLQACLSDGSPVVFGCTLFQSFATEPAVLPMPADGEPVLGPHAMVVVGIGYGHEWVDYPDADPDTRYVKVRNSWGTDAHNGGHLLIPTDYLVRYGADFWTIRSAR
jgi:hypothetical protein